MMMVFAMTCSCFFVEGVYIHVTPMAGNLSADDDSSRNRRWCGSFVHRLGAVSLVSY